ncbi:MAG TPA: hypothetical protein VHE57_00475 [Mycobacteriales bacterium]|nr:hypothetical protein [Mycobacteriales bacterium]
MTISEQSRHALHTRLVEVLGEQEAVVLMEHLPPVGWADVATKRDLDHLGAGLRGEIAELRGEFAELRGEFAELRGELLLKMSDLSRTLVLSVVATNCATIGAVAAMLALTR